MALTARYVTADGTDTYANSTNPATPMSLSTALANMAAGDEIWIKKGNYTGRPTDVTIPDGTAASPIVLHGYNAVIGDLDTPARNADGTLVTTDYPVLEYNAGASLGASGSNYLAIRNLKIGVAGTGFDGPLVSLGTNSVLHQSYVANQSTGASATAVTANNTGAVLEDNDLALTGASGGLAVINLGVSVRVIGNRFIDAQGLGIRVSGDNCVILDNVFFAPVVGPCIDVTTTGVSTVWTVRGNTAKGQAIMFRCANAAYANLSYYGDNHATDHGTGAFVSLRDPTSQIAGVFSHNRLRDNTTNIDGWDDWAAATSFGHVTTDTGGAETDYTDAAANQFALIDGAPGRGAASVPNRDIGAVQHADAAGGGGGSRGSMHLGL